MGELKYMDLVYGPQEIGDLIKKKWSDAKTMDASDCIHEERFELYLPEEVTKEEFYVFAIKEGFATCCLAFQIGMQSGKWTEKIKDWIEKAGLEVPA